MTKDSTPSIQDTTGATGTYSCPHCACETTHEVLVAANSRDFDDSGLRQTLNHYLTVRCKGCDTISFCHVWESPDEEDFDDEGRPFLVRHRTHYPAAAMESRDTAFVNPERFEQLAGLSSEKYDTTRLVQMLRELNHAYRTEGFISCILLLRAILDHVPPIFGQKTFTEVANNYGGSGKSFRDSMAHLDNASRKIADAQLHLQIRDKESIPTKAQVEFRADTDVLIAEVIRILRPKP